MLAENQSAQSGSKKIMTVEEALQLLRIYQEYAQNAGLPEVISGASDRFPEDGDILKAMRWLGFVQGYLLCDDWFTLQELKAHSKDPLSYLTWGDL